MWRAIGICQEETLKIMGDHWHVQGQFTLKAHQFCALASYIWHFSPVMHPRLREHRRQRRATASTAKACSHRRLKEPEAHDSG